MSLFSCWSHRHVFGSLLVLCVFAFFYLFFNHDFKFPEFDSDVETGNYSCPTILCDTGANPNCSSQRQTFPNHHGNQKIQSAPTDTEADTILLIWMWPFGVNYGLSCSLFNVTRCRLTDDRSVYHKAHGVIFHHLEITQNQHNMPTEPRPCFQKWVWLNMESPANSKPVPKINNLFNLTCNYRLDSSIPVPYGYLLPVTSEDESFKLPAKEKLVCWIVSNWRRWTRRAQFYSELKRHVKIDAYGEAFGRPVNDEEYSKIVSGCKFYLAFENSVYKDYITEKLFRTMRFGTVPIVLGPSRRNYEDHLPGNSFIHVDDFSSPKELAERIQYLDKNATEYMRYFDYRKRFKVAQSYFGLEHACKTCKYLRNNKGYETFHKLNEWYWG